MKNTMQLDFPMRTKYARHGAGTYYAEMGRYPFNKTPFLRFASYKEGPILTASVVDSGSGNVPAEGNIFIKNWSENEGVAEWLIERGFIMDPPLRGIPSGYVVIREYKMAPLCLQMLGEWDRWAK